MAASWTGPWRSALTRAAAWSWLWASAAALVVAVGSAVGHAAGLARVVMGSTAAAEVRLDPPVLGRRPPVFETRDAAGLPYRLDLSRGSALVLVYDRHCASCDLQMPRWLELIARMRGMAIPVYALSRSDAADQSQYWKGLKSSVGVLAPLDESVLTRVFGVRGTPCTILIREGHVAAVLHGEIDERRQAWLLAQVS